MSIADMLFLVSFMYGLLLTPVGFGLISLYQHSRITFQDNSKSQKFGDVIRP